MGEAATAIRSDRVVVERGRPGAAAVVDEECSVLRCSCSIAAVAVHGRKAREQVVPTEFHGGGGQRSILILGFADIWPTDSMCRPPASGLPQATIDEIRLCSNARGLASNYSARGWFGAESATASAGMMSVIGFFKAPGD